LIGEGEGADPARVRVTTVDEKPDTLGQTVGLSGAWTGQHEDRARVRLDCLTLGDRRCMRDELGGGGGDRSLGKCGHSTWETRPGHWLRPGAFSRRIDQFTPWPTGPPRRRGRNSKPRRKLARILKIRHHSRRSLLG